MNNNNNNKSSKKKMRRQEAGDKRVGNKTNRTQKPQSKA